ncbi:hypothetical protein KUTeg_010859 [Tegillarca granosa]|uniref:Uncharacterized protein n=1 Tax=Tegillarca granosa TaxID=220873 RepID=A0ABQ9F2F1_TEGGR|nr:hypothetical protein KUTeg_010859 [Tegillarca granosa]
MKNSVWKMSIDRPWVQDRASSPISHVQDKACSPIPSTPDRPSSPQPKTPDRPYTPQPKTPDRQYPPQPKVQDKACSPIPSTPDRKFTPQSKVEDRALSPIPIQMSSVSSQTEPRPSTPDGDSIKENTIVIGGEQRKEVVQMTSVSSQTESRPSTPDRDLQKGNSIVIEEKQRKEAVQVESVSSQTESRPSTPDGDLKKENSIIIVDEQRKEVKDRACSPIPNQMTSAFSQTEPDSDLIKEKPNVIEEEQGKEVTKSEITDNREVEKCGILFNEERTPEIKKITKNPSKLLRPLQSWSYSKSIEKSLSNSTELDDGLKKYNFVERINTFDLENDDEQLLSTRVTNGIIRAWSFEDVKKEELLNSDPVFNHNGISVSKYVTEFEGLSKKEIFEGLKLETEIAKNSNNSYYQRLQRGHKKGDILHRNVEVTQITAFWMMKLDAVCLVVNQLIFSNRAIFILEKVSEEFNDPSITAKALTTMPLKTFPGNVLRCGLAQRFVNVFGGCIRRTACARKRHITALSTKKMLERQKDFARLRIEEEKTEQLKSATQKELAELRIEQTKFRIEQ